MGEHARVTIRTATTADAAAWRTLWAEYCRFYEQSLPETVTQTLWARILQPNFPLHTLIAEDSGGNALGFANYVLHPHTWSEKLCCYLEDLYVRPEARGRSVGHALIEHLVALGREQDWNRVYWHTETGNAVARRLYDRFRPADDFVRYTVALPRSVEEP